jgi:hypothetical protein
VKKGAIAIVMLVFAVAILLPFSVGIQTVLAQGTGYTIQNVDHQVEVLYSGQMIIKDTIHLSGQLTGDFLIGFPYKYGSHVLKGIAYSGDEVFQVSLGVELAGQAGFYWAKASFPQGAPQVFTVVLFLDNGLLSPKTNGFILDFPAYPALEKGASQCDVNFVLPEVAVVLNVTKSDGVVFTESYVRENLPAFTYSPAILAFNVPAIWIRTINIPTLNRRVTISPAGDAMASDSYRITNTSPDTLGGLRMLVPINATNAVARDDFNRVLATEDLNNVGDMRLVNVTFISSLASGQSILLTIEYNLPNAVSEQGSGLTLNLDPFPNFNVYIDDAAVTFVLPEGASFLSPQLESIGSSSSLVREVFQETLTIRQEGVSEKMYSVLFENGLKITYEYNPLWLSFRPSLWALTVAVIGAVVVFVWRRPKTAEPVRMAAAKATIGLSPDHVKAFTEAYNEKTRIDSDLKVLEARAQKGRISRRRYKVQRRSLEVRLDAISKNIAELKRVFRSAGGVYADLIRQLDVAETELVEVEADTRNSEVRHRRGELPLEAYKKSLADYQRRKEKAETTINGILLRLREELR